MRFGLLLVLLLQVGCDDIQLVNANDRALLTKAKSGQYEVVTKTELQELRATAATAKAVGRYQIYNRGYRTFRLDTATGKTCILLATDADWKRLDTQAQNCALPFNQ